MVVNLILAVGVESRAPRFAALTVLAGTAGGKMAGVSDGSPNYRIAGTLIKLRGLGAAGFVGAAGEIARRGQVILEVASQAAGPGMAATGASWLRLDSGADPWSDLHALARAGGMGFGANGVLAAEPDWEWQWRAETTAAGATGLDAWHLEAGWTGLGAARTFDPDRQKAVLIAHLDTGFDPPHAGHPGHAQTPAFIDPGHRSFVRGDAASDGARDTAPGLPAVAQRGHGTATLALLAGPDYGGAPHATVLPLRVADSVLIVSTGGIVAGFNEAIRRKCQILSMSMGGLASAALADAVNTAYLDGMVLVTAAGNTLAGLPFPTIVWPARFRRVVAACGMMKDRNPYAWPRARPMAGCHGPLEKMRTAVSGFTPDVPWAEIGTGTGVERGGGTSSATPQIAAAAALWLAKWQDQLAGYAPWQRGEAVRQALFRSAAPGSNPYDPDNQPDPKLGWGPIAAEQLLATSPLPRDQLVCAPVANASHGLLKLITGTGVGFADARRDALFELEIVQLLDMHRDLAGETADGNGPPTIPDPDLLRDDRSADVQLARAVLERLEADPRASAPLRAEIRLRLAGGSSDRRTPERPPELTPQRIAARKRSQAAAAVRNAASPGVDPLTPSARRLRIYARDPSLGASLGTSSSLVATVDVRFEADLAPGPVGEYLEVIDIDPATDRFYEPVDLGADNLALSDGLKPSEGNPRFHQQMVYAVAMRTIDVFELALGRQALWASGRQPDDPPEIRDKIPAFRQRLRLYPHALRDANAYYSPAKVAILFGYFPSTASTRDAVPSGTMVFTCLSADIIAHEVTHALLDGLSPGFREASNPDVLAFHEGFADIVALFEQFRMADLVRREVETSRGAFSMSDLLGALASQFGQGRGGTGPLRDYGADARDAPATRKRQYDTSLPVHDLGAVLVSAVYDAFLAMASLRTRQLTRLATGGSGRLPEGELHPVLAAALTREICKAAADMQRIAIRALDYLPPNDINFGDYLSALITADVDAWPEDQSGYRTAIIEAFRRLDIYPRGLRTLSEETLVWRRTDAALARPDWLTKLVDDFAIRPGTNHSRAWMQETAKTRATKAQVAIKKALDAETAAGKTDLHDLLGLQPGLPRYSQDFEALPTSLRDAHTTQFYVDDVRPKIRELGRNEQNTQRLAFYALIRIRQRRPEWIDPANHAAGRFWFRGGATLIIDPFATHDDKVVPEICFAIAKSMTNPRRLERERAWRARRGSAGVHAAYFGSGGDAAPASGAAEPFAMIHRALTEED